MCIMQRWNGFLVKTSLLLIMNLSSITTKFFFPIPVMMTFSVPCSDNLCNAKICLAYSAVQVPTIGIFLEHLATVKIFIYLFN